MSETVELGKKVQQYYKFFWAKKSGRPSKISLSRGVVTHCSEHYLVKKTLLPLGISIIYLYSFVFTLSLTLYCERFRINVSLLHEFATSSSIWLSHQLVMGQMQTLLAATMITLTMTFKALATSLSHRWRRNFL